MTWVDISSGVYGFFFVMVAVFAGIGIVARHAIHRLIEDHMTEIRDELKRLDRIEYALYNDGQTGLINKVDQLIENQNVIKVDVEVIKAKAKDGL